MLISSSLTWHDMTTPLLLPMTLPSKESQRRYQPPKSRFPTTYLTCHARGQRRVGNIATMPWLSYERSAARCGHALNDSTAYWKSIPGDHSMSVLGSCLLAAPARVSRVTAVDAAGRIEPRSKCVLQGQSCGVNGGRIRSRHVGCGPGMLSPTVNPKSSLRAVQTDFA